MSKIKVRALINSVRDEKLIKIGEVFEIEESEKERLLKHGAIEIVVEDIIEESSLDEGSELKIEDTSKENKDGESGIGSADGLNKDRESGIGSADGLNTGDETDITLEEIQAMSVEEVETLAKENNIELIGKLKADKAQELFDKLGEE